MSELTFIKMHGLGNSYVYLDSWKHSVHAMPLSELAMQVSNVNTGIGSDGLIVMGPSSKADVRMRIFNKDGSEAKNCGNGLRCVAKYAYENGYVKDKSLTIETLSGIVKATIDAHEGSKALVTVDMGTPRLKRSEIPMLGKADDTVIQEPFAISGYTLHLTAVSMGNPHAVFFVPDLSNNPHMTLGPQIEKDPRFPDKVNVEFVSIESTVSLHCRVRERGSGVTQACGTGACAVAVAAILNGFCHKDQWITIHLEGGDLSIQWHRDGHIYMRGPAVTIATGTLK
jgi:diaminopimelate epimerase